MAVKRLITLGLASHISNEIAVLILDKKLTRSDLFSFLDALVKQASALV
jgi:hypothetical protein